MEYSFSAIVLLSRKRFQIKRQTQNKEKTDDTKNDFNFSGAINANGRTNGW